MYDNRNGLWNGEWIWYDGMDPFDQIAANENDFEC